MPTPTEMNTEDIKQLRDSQQRVVDALHLLELTVPKRYGELEVKVLESYTEIARLNAEAEARSIARHSEAMEQVKLLGRDVQTMAAIGKWVLGVALLILGSVGTAIWFTAKLDSRVGQLEQIKADATKR